MGRPGATMADVTPRKRWFRLFRKRDLIVLAGVVAVLCGFGGCMIWMPGKSYRGPLPALTAEQQGLRGALKRHVEQLAGRIGERHVMRSAALSAAAAYIEQTFVAAGYAVRRQRYEAAIVPVDNLEVRVEGRDRPDEIVIVGGHYDSVLGSPGANDNATGVAAMLELARAFAGKPTARTLRFVAFGRTRSKCSKRCRKSICPRSTSSDRTGYLPTSVQRCMATFNIARTC